MKRQNIFLSVFRAAGFDRKRGRIRRQVETVFRKTSKLPPTKSRHKREDVNASPRFAVEGLQGNPAFSSRFDEQQNFFERQRSPGMANVDFVIHSRNTEKRIG